jgi:hypothetical protein
MAALSVKQKKSLALVDQGQPGMMASRTVQSLVTLGLIKPKRSGLWDFNTQGYQITNKGKRQLCR